MYLSNILTATSLSSIDHSLFFFVFLGCHYENYIIFSTTAWSYLHSFCKWCHLKRCTSPTRFFWWYFDIWGLINYPFHDMFWPSLIRMQYLKDILATLSVTWYFLIFCNPFVYSHCWGSGTSLFWHSYVGILTWWEVLRKWFQKCDCLGK